MSRHQKADVVVPSWARKIKDDCTYEVAVDALTARHHAERHGARHVDICKPQLRAADKALESFIKTKDTRAGLRADRKYWEAKVCARQVLRGEKPLSGTRRK